MHHFRVKYSLSGWLCGRRRGLHSGFIPPFIQQEVIAVIMVGSHVFISPSSKLQQNKAVQESLQRNMPHIIISLTHLFVSLGISEGRKGIFYRDKDGSLNEGLPSNNLGYPLHFAHQREREREDGLSAGRTLVSGNVSVLCILSLSLYITCFKDKSKYEKKNINNPCISSPRLSFSALSHICFSGHARSDMACWRALYFQ